MFNNMWSLFVGTTEVTDDEEENELNEATKMAARRELANIPPLHSTRITRPEEVVSKVRIPSPAREQGDGMEADQEVAKASAAEEVPPVSIPKPKLITLPQTNIQLDKLPPITADRDIELPALVPGTPLVQMTGSAISSSGPKTSKAHSKEPKFVPYEPYKAAVSKMRAPPAKLRRRKSSLANNVSKGDAAIEATEEEHGEQPAAASPDEQSQPTASKPEPQPSREDRLVTGILDDANTKIKDLEASLAEAQKQLKIQTQVNAEVKKLLVASVGEDIEARVDYLTQDKARLAADIRQYSNKMCKDFEEKEKLSVESDLWKSKFLACSVIVDELARWKGSLVQRNDEVDHHIRLLLHERSVLWDSMVSNYQVLSQVRSAFDPLSTAQADEPEVVSVLGLADLSLKAGRDLKDRLMADKKAAVAKAVQVTQMDTPAEGGLRDLAARPVVESAEDYSTKASIAVTGAARPHLAKMNDKLSSPNVNSSQFKCCTHCKGSVQLV